MLPHVLEVLAEQLQAALPRAAQGQTLPTAMNIRSMSVDALSILSLQRETKSDQT